MEQWSAVDNTNGFPRWKAGTYNSILSDQVSSFRFQAKQWLHEIFVQNMFGGWVINMSERRVGLVLGGGGGKGAAHIGVLNALEALAVPIDVLAGTSIGGLVAAFYAVGYTPLEIEQWFGRATARNILERDPSNFGFLGTRKIEALLREALGDRTFADARMPLALTAVDVTTGQEIVLREGALVEAVRATIAVPGIFAPVVRGDQLLVDGGVLNNVPVNVAHDLGAGQVIAVDLGLVTANFQLPTLQPADGTVWSPRRWVPRNQLLLAERALAIMMAQITEQRLRQTPPTVLLRPVVGTVMPFDFTKTVQGRMLGERAAFAERANLEAVRQWRREGS